MMLGRRGHLPRCLTADPPLCVAGPLLFINFIMTHFVEVKRWQDFRKPKSQGEPGSFFGFESVLGFSGVNGEAVAR